MATPKKKNIDSVAIHYYDAVNDTYPAWEGLGTTTLLALRYDEASSTISYVGEAVAGSAEGSAVWRIRRLTDSSGDLTIEWADGNTSFDNIWTNRASLTYS